MKDDRLYLIHIDECIKRIESYTAGGYEDFISSELIQDAVLRNLHTLAESTQRLSSGLKDRYPDVDWAGIAGFRNVIVHGYLEINMERVWAVLEHDLPEFKQVIEALLAE